MHYIFQNLQSYPLLSCRYLWWAMRKKWSVFTLIMLLYSGKTRDLSTSKTLMAGYQSRCDCISERGVVFKNTRSMFKRKLVKWKILYNTSKYANARDHFTFYYKSNHEDLFFKCVAVWGLFEEKWIWQHVVELMRSFILGKNWCQTQTHT